MRTDSARPTLALVLTLIVILLVPVATLAGLLVPGFYRDTAWMIPQARGQDLVTLLVAEPLLIGAFIAARWSRVFAQLLWMGSLSYVLYTYAMYSYTAYFNALFLVYVALFSASLFALVDVLVHLDLSQAVAAVRPTVPARTIAAYLALLGALFAVTWLGQIIPATLPGTVPPPVALAKTPTSAVHVQDLAVVIPLLFAAAAWLWRRRSWGFVVAPVLLVLADIMLLALLAMGAFSAWSHISGALDMEWPFVVLTAVNLGFTALFAAHLRRPALVDRVAAPDLPAPRELTPTGPRAG
jgi:hypothetical protein